WLRDAGEAARGIGHGIPLIRATPRRGDLHRLSFARYAACVVIGRSVGLGSGDHSTLLRWHRALHAGPGVVERRGLRPSRVALSCVAAWDRRASLLGHGR